MGDTDIDLFTWALVGLGFTLSLIGLIMSFVMWRFAKTHLRNGRQRRAIQGRTAQWRRRQ